MNAGFDTHLLLQLRADLKESQGDRKWGANEANMALLEAQQEALAQEEAAELARGELDDFKRRFQAEIQHARDQARLGLPSHQAGTDIVQSPPRCYLISPYYRL